MSSELKLYKVLMSEELWRDFGLRNLAGDRLTFDWGEPDADGFYTPTVTAHRDDNIRCAHGMPAELPGVRLS